MKKLIRRMYASRLRRRFHLKSKAGLDLCVSAFLKDYRKRELSVFQIHSIHAKGFSVNDWCILGLNKSNYKRYMKTVDYCRLHPLNGKYSKWIDDKLTLKYILHGSPLSKYMPEYYFSVEGNGNVTKLMNFQCKEGVTSSQVSALLREKKVLAVKREAGAIGEGFYKATYCEQASGGVYLLNDEAYDEQGFEEKIKSLSGYLITEFLFPHPTLAKLAPDTINPTRYLLAKNHAGEFLPIVQFIRIGTKKSGNVENYARGGVLCFLDDEGKFEYGNIIDEQTKKNVVVVEHPDSGEPLVGQCPRWDEMKEVALELYGYMPSMSYLGIDFAVTNENEIKILEINSLGSLDAIQFQGPIFEREAGAFFKELLASLK